MLQGKGRRPDERDAPVEPYDTGASGNDFDLITDQPATRGAQSATRGAEPATRYAVNELARRPRSRERRRQIGPAD